MTRVVDFHAHFLPRSIIEAARTGKPWHGTRVETDPDGFPVLVTGGKPKTMGSTWYWDDPEVRLDRMTAAGVDTQVLSVAPALFRYASDARTGIEAATDVNDEIASMHERWPDRYLGYATLPLQDVDAAVAELDRAVNTLGLVGAAVGTHVNGENWDSPALLPVLRAAEELGALLFFHPCDQRIKGSVAGYHLSNTIGNPLETVIAVGQMIFSGTLDRVPDAKLLFAHAGGFTYCDAGRFDHAYRLRADASAAASRLPSEYLTGLYWDCLSHSGPALRHLLDTVGSSQVVLGTDYPADMGLAEPVAWLDACSQITGAERDRILRGNAGQLLGDRVPA